MSLLHSLTIAECVMPHDGKMSFKAATKLYRIYYYFSENMVRAAQQFA